METIIISIRGFPWSQWPFFRDNYLNLEMIYVIWLPIVGSYNPREKPHIPDRVDTVSTNPTPFQQPYQLGTRSLQTWKILWIHLKGFRIRTWYLDLGFQPIQSIGNSVNAEFKIAREWALQPVCGHVPWFATWRQRKKRKSRPWDSVKKKKHCPMMQSLSFFELSGIMIRDFIEVLVVVFRRFGFQHEKTCGQLVQF